MLAALAVVVLPIFSQGLLEEADAVTQDAEMIATAPADDVEPLTP